MREMIKLAHSKPSADATYGSYSLCCKFQLINANLIQTQIRSGLEFMSQQVLNEGDHFLIYFYPHQPRGIGSLLIHVSK